MILTVTLLTHDRHAELTLNFQNDDISSEVFTQFINCFKHERLDQKTINIISQQQTTAEQLTSIEQLALKFGKNAPRFYALHSFFRKMEEGEYFFILPFKKSDLTIFDIFKAQNELQKLNGKNYTDPHQIEDLFSEVSNNYRVTIVEEKHKTGSSKKTNRICRFCENLPQKSLLKKKHMQSLRGLEIKRLLETMNVIFVMESLAKVSKTT